MLAWHFCKNDKRLGYDDGRRIRVGKTLRVTGEPVLCEHGLHGSARLIDALQYAQGHMICRVRLGGVIVKDDDKAAATERTVLWMLDGEKLLHKFACRVATIALTDAKVKDARCWQAIEIKRRWLRGAATNSELAAAWVAARDAARAVAWDAAGRRFNRVLTAMVCAANKKAGLPSGKGA